MIKVSIKPLSVNQAWQGKRFKTPAYKQYERDCLLLLPKVDIPEGYLEAQYVFGFSSKLSDWDNPIKPMQDILQKKYEFDDKRIKKASIVIEKVSKGEEFFAFNFIPYEWKD